MIDLLYFILYFLFLWFIFSDKMNGKKRKRVQAHPKIPVSKQAAKRAKDARECRIVVDNNNSPMIYYLSDTAPVEDFIQSLIKVKNLSYDIR